MSSEGELSGMLNEDIGLIGLVFGINKLCDVKHRKRFSSRDDNPNCQNPQLDILGYMLFTYFWDSSK